jgi:predicted nucleic acid-binding protein
MLIRAFRYDHEAERMEAVLSASTVYLSSVVAKELLAGARPDEMRRLQRHFLDPYEALGRMATPRHRCWLDAGTILRKLRADGFQITASLTNDVLIAVSATEVGAILVHDNRVDFEAIARHYPRLRQKVGWPALVA